MIVLTRLNGVRFGINDEQIERIEDGADTVVVLVNGNRYTAKESLDEVIDAIVNFRARVLDAASLGDEQKVAAQKDASIALFRPHSVLADDTGASEIDEEGHVTRPPSLLDTFRNPYLKDEK